MKAFLSKSMGMRGWDIHIYREDEGNFYRAKIKEIEWELSPLGAIFSPTLQVREIDHYDQVDKQSALHGENQALKDEIKFLRQHISNILMK